MDNNPRIATQADIPAARQAAADAGIVMEVIDDEPTRRWVSPEKVATLLDDMAEAAA